MPPSLGIRIDNAITIADPAISSQPTDIVKVECPGRIRILIII